MKRHRLYRLTWSLTAAALMLVTAAYGQPEPDKDYQTIKTPQATADPKKIEVIEFFSYACPHCA